MWLSCSPLSRFAVVNWQMPLVWADKGRSTKPWSGFVPSRGEKNNLSIYHGEPCEMKVFFLKLVGEVTILHGWYNSSQESMSWWPYAIFSPLVHLFNPVILNSPCTLADLLPVRGEAAATERWLGEWLGHSGVTLWVLWDVVIFGALHNYVIFFCNQSPILQFMLNSVVL